MHPSEISGLQSRLISRFVSGLTISISKPEFETSKAILKKKIEGREESITCDNNLCILLNQLIIDSEEDFLTARMLLQILNIIN